MSKKNKTLKYEKLGFILVKEERVKVEADFQNEIF